MISLQSAYPPNQPTSGAWGGRTLLVNLLNLPNPFNPTFQCNMFIRWTSQQAALGIGGLYLSTCWIRQIRSIHDFSVIWLSVEPANKRRLGWEDSTCLTIHYPLVFSPQSWAHFSSHLHLGCGFTTEWKLRSGSQQILVNTWSVYKTRNFLCGSDA